MPDTTDITTDIIMDSLELPRPIALVLDAAGNI
jgi:hypothetical protein